jgi:imidazole glycerol-phosphate synthase subunit HisH
MARAVIIDYGSGNLHSAAKALERANIESSAGHDIVVSSQASDVLNADRVVLPGVGAFGDCRAGLSAVDGMLEALETVVRDKQRPFLGICVGMQLMATEGLEFGTTPGLDWISGRVEAVAPDDPNLKIPHMGWNTLTVERDHALLAGLNTGKDGLHAYFVHSYHFVTRQPEAVIARTDYGGPVTAMIGKNNMAGTQFHPEKSQTLGLKLLANFLHWTP